MMMNTLNCLNLKNYGGKIKNERGSYTFSFAGLKDAEQISRMYSGISINETNYAAKLDSENEKNFNHTGGMFVIHTKESIESEIRDKKSYFAVIKNAFDEIVASLWISGSDPSFADFDALSMDPMICPAENAPSDGNIIFPREIITDKRYRLAGIAGVLCYTVFSAAREAGLSWALGEVYKVRSYEIGGSGKEIFMLNRSGYDTITGMGGRFIGTFPPRDIRIKSLRVVIEPQVFIINLDETLTVLEHSVNNSGLSVYWE